MVVFAFSFLAAPAIVFATSPGRLLATVFVVYALARRDITEEERPGEVCAALRAVLRVGIWLAYLTGVCLAVLIALFLLVAASGPFCGVCGT